MHPLINFELSDNVYKYCYITTHFIPKKIFFDKSICYVYDRTIDKYRILCHGNCGNEKNICVTTLDDLLKNNKHKKLFSHHGVLFIKTNDIVTWTCKKCYINNNQNTISNTDTIKISNSIKPHIEENIKLIYNNFDDINNKLKEIIRKISNQDNCVTMLVFYVFKNINCKNIKIAILYLCDTFIDTDTIFKKIEHLYNLEKLYNIENELNMKQQTISNNTVKKNKNICKTKSVYITECKKLKLRLIKTYEKLYTSENYKNSENIGNQIESHERQQKL